MRVEKILSAVGAAAGQLLTAFRNGARTVGLSPKALAGPIGLAITGLLALVGLTPEVIGDALGVDPVLVGSVEVALAAKIAAILLPPGEVVPAPQ